MSLIQSLILGFIQGVTEFLPISSSGHLNLAQHFFGLVPSLTFDIFLNTATFISVLFYFRKEIPYFFKNLLYIIIGSIPAGLVGFLFKDQLETVFSNIKLLPYLFLITSFFVFSTRFLTQKNQKLDVKKALIIGLFQAVAILPGVSRAGSTIFAGLLLGLSTEEAFKYSFCLFIPASLGALLLDARHLSVLSLINSESIISFAVTVVVGIIALNFLKKTLVNKKFWYFGVYTFILSLILLFAL